MKTLFVGVWGLEDVAWIVELGRFPRHGDEGVVFCNCYMSGFGLLGVFGVDRLYFGGCLG